MAKAFSYSISAFLLAWYWLIFSQFLFSYFDIDFQKYGSFKLSDWGIAGLTLALGILVLTLLSLAVQTLSRNKT